MIHCPGSSLGKGSSALVVIVNFPRRRPKLGVCCCSWSPESKGHLKLLQEFQRLLRPAQHLKRIVDVWKAGSTNLSPPEVQPMFDAWTGFLGLTSGLPELESPKRHLFTNLLIGVVHHGNPKRYANWLNESDNRTLKLACRTVSQTTFETFLLLRMQELLSVRHEKRQRHW